MSVESLDFYPCTINVCYTGVVRGAELNKGKASPSGAGRVSKILQDVQCFILVVSKLLEMYLVFILVVG